MNEADTGIEKETISFGTTETKSQKTLEVKYTIADSSFKTQLPTFKDGSAEDLLHFIYEFKQAQAKLGYNTYQKLESGIEQLLKGTARNEWNTIKQTVQPNTNTVITFTRRVESLKSIYIPDPAAVENQKTYLHRIRKTDKFTVPQFLDRMKHINMLISQFPGATERDCFTPDEIKRLFHHAMPTRWRTNFLNSGQSLMTTNMEVLRTYMVQQEQQTDAHRKKTRDVNRKSQNQGNNNNNNDKQNSRKSFKHNKRNSSSKASSNRDSKKQKLDNNDDCPIHGSTHKWGQCHQNQYGDNFRPQRSQTGTGSTNPGSSSRSNFSHYTSRHPPTDIQVYTNDRSSRNDGFSDDRSLRH